MSSSLDLQASASQEWYTYSGPDTDVVLSTRVRLARNLADFPFPRRFRNDDSARVQTLVFDSFLKSGDPDSYQNIAVASLNRLGSQMLIERGLIEASTLNSPGAGIVMRISGSKANSGLVCTINDVDHVRISCFVPGLDCDKALSFCREMDETLQRNLQFAASYDFGYLTADVDDCGSGMKISARVHLPSLFFLGKIPSLFETFAQKGIVAEPAFGSGSQLGSSIGAFYQISSAVGGNGSELDQLANFTGALRQVIENERKSCDMVIQKRTTEATDKVLKSFSSAKFSLLLSLREALLLISDLKWGKNLDLISGIDDSDISSLLYRIQEAHLLTVIKNGQFNFPLDIADDEKKQTARLRALIIQDAFENIKLSEQRP